MIYIVYFCKKKILMTGIVTNNKYLPREKDKHDNDQNDDEVI